MFLLFLCDIDIINDIVMTILARKSCAQLNTEIGKIPRNGITGPNEMNVLKLEYL